MLYPSPGPERSRTFRPLALVTYAEYLNSPSASSEVPVPDRIRQDRYKKLPQLSAAAYYYAVRKMPEAALSQY